MDYACPDPTATVRAANVRATLEAFRLLPHVGKRIVERHALHLEDLTPDRFIPVQSWLDALRDIETQVGSSKLREVGRNIIANAAFPPALKTVEAVLLALDEIYHHNHRGDVGHYRVTRESDQSIRVRCETPYPRSFEWGLVQGIVANRRGSSRYTVQYTPGPDTGPLTCTLTVRKL